MADGIAETESNLRRMLADAEQRNLNAVDAIRGAEAQVAQVKRDADELFHRLDLRETELRQLKSLLGFELETPLEEIRAALQAGAAAAGQVVEATAAGRVAEPAAGSAGD